MIVNTSEEAYQCKGRFCAFSGDIKEVVVSEVRRFGNIWHGWVYNVKSRSEAIGWIPLHLLTIID